MIFLKKSGCKSSSCLRRQMVQKPEFSRRARTPWRQIFCLARVHIPRNVFHSQGTQFPVNEKGDRPQAVSFLD